MIRCILLLFQFVISSACLAQGLNSHWLLGNDSGWPNVGRFIFDGSSYNLINEQRQMIFKGTQATIADPNGNFLMSSNGVWIANANNMLMLNGDNLNPSWDVTAHPNGLLIINGNIFLPFPGDSTKFILIHEAKLGQFAIDLMGVYKSVIDITLDNGLGAVIQKNDTILEDTLSWGIAATKHANGRDWWVIFITDGNPEIYTVLLTPAGISNLNKQVSNINFNTWGNLSQITFSQDGTKFIYTSPINQTQETYLLLANFDRCTGQFSNLQTLQLTSNSYIWGLAFSSSGKYVYASTSNNIFQINTNNLTIDTVAIYDGFISGLPPNCCATTFAVMYLAANGKIYITSGSSVQHIHEMNFPDSAGTACDVQQHNIALQNYWHLRAVPNHPNYYLGAVAGSVCDSLSVVINEVEHNFKFSVFPNPSNGDFRIMYLLPQNKKGLVEVFDINGRIVYSYNLPHWSTLQQFNLSHLSEGIYAVKISSDGYNAVKKLIITE